MTKQEISMAIDAIEDAIENRRIAKQPCDKGLKLAQQLVLKLWVDK